MGTIQSLAVYEPHRTDTLIYRGLDGMGAYYSEAHARVAIVASEDDDEVDFIVCTIAGVRTLAAAKDHVARNLKLGEHSPVIEKARELLDTIEARYAENVPECPWYGGFPVTRMNGHGMTEIQWGSLTDAAVELYEAIAEQERTK